MRHHYQRKVGLNIIVLASNLADPFRKPSLYALIYRVYDNAQIKSKVYPKNIERLSKLEERECKAEHTEPVAITDPYTGIPWVIRVTRKFIDDLKTVLRQP